MKCINCGSKEQTGMYCSVCGAKIGSGTNKTSWDNNDAEYDSYEKLLEERKRREKTAKDITAIFSAVMCLAAIWNNWGYREFGEIVIICVLVIIVAIAVYSAIAAKMGFYKAEEYLKKYILLKKEMGATEAIKIIEETIDRKEGYSMLKIGIIGGYEFGKAGIKGILGFIISVCLLIIAISLC